MKSSSPFSLLSLFPFPFLPADFPLEWRIHSRISRRVCPLHDRREGGKTSRGWRKERDAIWEKGVCAVTAQKNHRNVLRKGLLLRPRARGFVILVKQSEEAAAGFINHLLVTPVRFLSRSAARARPPIFAWGGNTISHGMREDGGGAVSGFT